MELRENVHAGKPRQSTTLQVAWNAETLWVRFNVQDDDIRATMTERDAPLYKEEVVEAFLDSTGDLESYVEIEVNPLNTVLDLIIRRTFDGDQKNFQWRCEGIETTATPFPGGWCAVLAIPFAGLGSIRPKVGDVWRGNFYRIDRPANSARELSALSPTGVENFHVPERFGWIDFTGGH